MHKIRAQRAGVEPRSLRLLCFLTAVPTFVPTFVRPELGTCDHIGAEWRLFDACVRETVRVRTFNVSRFTSTRRGPKVTAIGVGLLLTVTAAALTSGGSVGAAVTTRSKASVTARKKVTTTRRRATTRRVTTAKRVTTRAAGATTLPPSTLNPSAPATTSLVATTAATTSPPISVAPVSPVAFERSTYTLTAASDTNYEVRFFLNIAPGFNDTLALRTTQLPAGVVVGFEPNPVRNLFAMSLRVPSSAPPVFDFDITASASAASSLVLARTSITLFVNGTLLPTSQPPIGDPGLPPGVAYTVSPSSVEVIRGGDAATVKIDLFRQGGFAGPVSFQMNTVLPAGMGFSFQANPVTGAVNYLFISAGASTVPGTYVIDFLAITSLQSTPLRAVVVVK